jgi:hypothetical protein
VFPHPSFLAVLPGEPSATSVVPLDLMVRLRKPRPADWGADRNGSGVLDEGREPCSTGANRS